MEEILAEIRSWQDHTTQLGIVEKWYKLDENAIPPEYNLQPIVKYHDMENFLKEPRRAFNYEDLGYMDYMFEEESMIDRIENTITELGDTGEFVEEAKRVYKELAGQEKKIWYVEEPVLSKTIRQAVANCIKHGKLTKEGCHKYFQSSEWLFYFLKIIK